jgi:hypothetical protein
MRNAILAGTALLASGMLYAADDIKPFDAKVGLWETVATTQMSGMPAMPAMPQLSEEQLSKMPPEARARVQAAMKGIPGVGSPTTNTSRSCMTEASFKKALELGSQQNCTRKVVSSSSSKQEIHIECTQSGATTAGDLTVERVDSEHAKGSMTANITMANAGVNPKASGGPMTMKMTFNSKWLGADCGSVKPLE